MKTLIEAAQDQEITIDPNRNIRFLVERNSFLGSWSGLVSLDSSLLEQALNNLLDNAAKYSFDRTEVTIYGGSGRRGGFQITVANFGLPIRPSDVGKLIRRGYRTPEADAVTQEGSGIGLWIVDNIMKAHGGELVLIPTKPNGQNEVKLVFPVNE